jgi:hypothetical protein
VYSIILKDTARVREALPAFQGVLQGYKIHVFSITTDPAIARVEIATGQIPFPAIRFIRATANDYFGDDLIMFILIH